MPKQYVHEKKNLEPHGHWNPFIVCNRSEHIIADNAFVYQSYVFNFAEEVVYKKQCFSFSKVSHKLSYIRTNSISPTH